MGLRSLIRAGFNRFGYRLVPAHQFTGSHNPFCELLPQWKIVDLERLSNIALSIPGMISPRSGQMLYSLCAFQCARGDVVEIGSWQGRSSSFLARAAKDSNNGRFYAIDHFKGNTGKETSYVIGSQDLSDLKQGFLKNMARLKLENHVHLLEMPNIQAATEFEDGSVRFLFIDGDHTYEGVCRDLKLFTRKLCAHAIIVFDDFSHNFPGLLVAVDQFLKQFPNSLVMSYENTLVARL